MLCAVAHPSRDPFGDLLKQAEQAYLLHQSQIVIDACQTMQVSSNSALKAEAMLLEAKLRFDLDQRDRAIALLSDARTLIPADARPIAGLARLALATGNHGQALQLAEQAARADPLEPSVLCSLALVYATEQHCRSLSAWTAASALAPDDCLIAQMAYAAAFVEGRHSEGLALVERLSRYQGLISRTNEYAGLAGLITAARRQYLTVGALKDSLGAMQPDAERVSRY
jgi:tetratricopeptide (TPR) repeat protein